MILRATTDSVDATRAFAGALAPLAAPGDVVLLSGDLGAGKTAFAEGFGRGLGIDEQITSPTFTLARQYQGRLPLHHLDVYRLERMYELFDVGLPEMLDEGGVVLIEWGDVISSALPADYLEIHFAYGEGDDDRCIDLRSVGARWHARWGRVGLAVESWQSNGGATGGGAC